MGDIMNEKLIRFWQMTAGTLIMAVGVYFFKFTNNFTFGGITGFSVLVAKTGVISASDFTFIANMSLLVLGMIVLGKEFTIKTAYSTALLSITLTLLERFCPMSHPLTDEPMLELVFAVVLPAIGSAILFNIGSSSGGTDVIALIMKKYTSIDIGKGLMLSDVLFTLAGCVVFDIKTGLFSMLGLVIRSYMIDGFIESFNLSKFFNVICSDPEPICEFIKKDLHRGATVVEAKGAFSGQQKYIILTALNRMQAIRLRNYIKAQDPRAFILITNTSEIIGKGFHSV